MTTSRPILIGMTGCGKSTVGKELARLAGFSFVDLDEMLVKGEGKTPREIFDEQGEDYFRKLEHGYLLKALELENAVISCGGGVVLLEENRKALAGQEVIWIVRSGDAVLQHKGVLSRPPVNGDPENYKRLYRARRRLYATCAKTVIGNVDSWQCAADLARMYGYVK